MKKHPEKLNHNFDVALAIEAMIFCIQNNDIFSVQYDLSGDKQA